MIIDTQLSSDLFVNKSEDIIPIQGITSNTVRFFTTYKGEFYLVDFSPDDEINNSSEIGCVGPLYLFSEFSSLISTTYRTEFQTWYRQHLQQR